MMAYEHLMKMASNDTVWHTVKPRKSGFAVNGEIRDIKILNTKGNAPLILVSRNNESPQLFIHAQ